MGLMQGPRDYGGEPHQGVYEHLAAIRAREAADAAEAALAAADEDEALAVAPVELPAPGGRVERAGTVPLPIGPRAEAILGKPKSGGKRAGRR